MPRNVTKTVYTFDELNDNAKEKAREWYREGALDGYDWWDSIYEDAERMAEKMGLHIKQKPVKLMNGKTRYKPEIYFSGFSHQGSGSSYAGTWYASDVKPGAVKEEAPTDKELHRIASILEELAKENPELSASISSKKDNWIHVEVEHGETRDEVLNDLDYDSPAYKAESAKDNEREETLIEALRDFNRWIYKQLQAEYEYRMSDEVVDEEIRANDYEFHENGAFYS